MLIFDNKFAAALAFHPPHLERKEAAHAPGWLGHVPFLNWLIANVRPANYVELGTHYGNSFFSACESVAASGLDCKCHAVDTWKGDAHSSAYDDDVFRYVEEVQSKQYENIAKLHRCLFDDALEYFDDSSIELLHIDGYHSYDAVRHDYETWLPKMKPGSMILFHDTVVQQENFGVWKLWNELIDLHPLHFEFLHSNGLGIIGVEFEQTDTEFPLADYQNDENTGNLFRSFFEAAGRSIGTLVDYKNLVSEGDYKVRSRLLEQDNRRLVSALEMVTRYDDIVLKKSAINSNFAISLKPIQQIDYCGNDGNFDNWRCTGADPQFHLVLSGGVKAGRYLLYATFADDNDLSQVSVFIDYGEGFSAQTEIFLQFKPISFGVLQRGYAAKIAIPIDCVGIRLDPRSSPGTFGVGLLMLSYDQ